MLVVFYSCETKAQPGLSMFDNRHVEENICAKEGGTDIRIDLIK
jgi:hypothetical protein